MEEKRDKPPTPKWRIYLPQILASMAKNLLILDLGLAGAFPTIAIPALTGLKPHAESADDPLRFNEVQASWFGSIAFICTPLGNVLSGWVTEPIGRRYAMILLNFPHIIAWIMIYRATTVTEMYAAAILMGLGSGFMEAPVVTYVGEISQPRIRGILTSCAGVMATFGFFMGYLLGTVFYWRTLALVCLSVPLFTMVAIFFIPETPFWLLAHGRKEEALKSLCWLRGWVKPEEVEKEFTEMQRYSKFSTKCTPCQKASVTDCEHPSPGFKAHLKELVRKRTVKPIVIVTVFFAITQFCGMAGMRPYLIQIFQAYGVPVDPSWATVIVGLMKFLANIFCMLVVKFVGKRRISLYSIAGTAICCISLGIYGAMTLPAGWSSFEKHNIEDVPGNGWFPMVIFFLLAFITSAGMIPIPWMLLSEVFPYKSRASASGIVAAMAYIMVFTATKTYLDLENALGMPGLIFLYGAVGIFGWFFFYYLLPETEDRSLEDIETHFSTQSIWNIKIKRVSELENQKARDAQAAIENGAEKKDKGVDNLAFVERM